MLRFLLVLLAIPIASAIATTSADYTVPLDKYSLFSIGGAQVRVAVHDDGPTEIRVRLDYSNPIAFPKHNGFDATDTETLIYQSNKSRLYYVNVISGQIGKCILRIKSD